MTTDRTAARALVFDRVHRSSAKRGMRMSARPAPIAFICCRASMAEKLHGNCQGCVRLTHADALVLASCAQYEGFCEA
jgi:hypothetical protein